MGWSKSEVKDFTLGMKEISDTNRIKICPKPFYTLAVNFDGKVSTCCVDWSYGTIVGDLTCQSLLDIWNGKDLQNFRMKHLKGKKKTINVCNMCHYLETSTSEDDILDNYVEKLIKFFN